MPWCLLLLSNPCLFISNSKHYKVDWCIYSAYPLLPTPFSVDSSAQSLSSPARKSGAVLLCCPLPHHLLASRPPRPIVRLPPSARFGPRRSLSLTTTLLYKLEYYLSATRPFNHHGRLAFILLLSYLGFINALIFPDLVHSQPRPRLPVTPFNIKGGDSTCRGCG